MTCSIDLKTNFAIKLEVEFSCLYYSKSSLEKGFWGLAVSNWFDSMCSFDCSLQFVLLSRRDLYFKMLRDSCFVMNLKFEGECCLR